MSGALTKQAEDVGIALRVVAATSLCLFIGEWWHLDMIYLSLFSAHLVMSQYTFTSFQKGVERVVGRFLGVSYGLLLLAFFREVPLLFLILLIAWQMVAFYLYASSHLAYTAMQAGVFAPTVAQVGMSGDVAGALTSGCSILIQVVIGVTAATLVNGLTGLEDSLHVEARGQALLPLRWDWINESAMWTTTAMLALFATLLLQLPVVPTMVSAMIVGLAVNPADSRKKASQRAIGVLIGGAYGFMGLLLLARVHSFGLLVIWTEFGMFLASYLTRASTHWSYAALQTGMVIPMVLVGSNDELGSMLPALERFVGIVVGPTISITVEFLWPAIRPPER